MEKINVFFLMPKFRTMNIGTPQIDTLSLKNPKNYLTPVGSFLRKTSIDELPQLFSVLIGKMSLVGPRPALFTQTDLIDMRDKYNINDMTPGITGYSQIKGRDDIDLKKKVELDNIYLNKRSLFFDLYIIVMTIAKLADDKNIKH